ncbi:NPCBM/NEW2 domain-containing protein [Deinococcus radiopugnans]|uniref:NPCBM/NEW2 domain-containing protein n=1 Tax=Deinococcus radiopugnans TaxID=57497 RepID=UPI003614737B
MPAEDRPTSYDLALVRLTQAGTTDASFGQNGAVITSLNGNRLFDPENHLPDEKIYGVALQPDGKLVIVGESEVDGAQYAVLGRYLSGGQLDSGFGSGGLAAPAGSYSGFRTVALQPDGQIVAGGGDDRFLTTAYLQKFSSAGVGGARARFQFSSAEDASFQQTVVTSLLLDRDGSVVVGGYNDADAYVARFTSTLQQDAAFGGRRAAMSFSARAGPFHSSAPPTTASSPPRPPQKAGRARAPTDSSASRHLQPPVRPFGKPTRTVCCRGRPGCRRGHADGVRQWRTPHLTRQQRGPVHVPLHLKSLFTPRSAATIGHAILCRPFLPSVPDVFSTGRRIHMSTPFVPLLLGCAALLLVSCSPKPAPPGPPDDGRPADSPYTGGRQYPWSDRLAPHGADAYADGHRYPWRSPTAASGLDSRPTENGHNLLSALPWTSATNGWGPVERDRSNGWQASGDGTTLKVGGRTFASGLGVHADSEIRYALGGQCQTFTASVGVDDEVGPRGSVRFNVFGDDTLLSGGEVRRGGESALPIEVGVTGVQELRLEVRGGEDNHYDHADWGDAAVECTAAAPDNDITLSRLAYVSASNGWGPVELDRSNGPQGLRDGGPLTVAGQAFATGLGVHAPSTLEYDLGGVCTTFSAQLGVDDETGGRGSVTFQVSGDGRTLYDSAVVRGHDPVTPARVDVTGIHALKLTVTDGGDGLNHDHADWAGARLDCGTSAPGRAGTPDPSFGTGGGRTRAASTWWPRTAARWWCWTPTSASRGCRPPAQCWARARPA